MRIGVGMIICLLVAMVTSGEGVDRDNQYCVFKGTADDGSIVTLDLSKIIQFPVTVNDMSNSIFTYAINLCESISCSDQHKEESACLRGGMEHDKPFDFSLGKISTAEWKIRSTSPLDFTVTYTGGDKSEIDGGNLVSRSSVFHFMESNEKTTVANTGQSSRTLQYTFSITGRRVRESMTSSLFAKKQVADDGTQHANELGSSDCTHTGKADDDGSKVTIDLSQIIKFPVTVPDKSSTSFSYKVDLCNSVKCTDQLKECACQHGGQQHNKDFDFSLGKISTAVWDIKSASPLEFTVTYTEGDPSNPDFAGDASIDGTKKVNRSAQFHFVYSDQINNTEMKMSGQDKSNLVYKFTVTGKGVQAATGSSSKGGKGVQSGYAGLIVIVLALCAVVTYFTVGAVINYQLRGARGVEVIPNINFWTELPLLIKDGCVFTFGPLIRLVRKDQGYEKI